MVIPSEYIQIISAGIYAMALFFTIEAFRRTRRLDQMTLSNNIFSELRDLDRELAKIPSGSQYDDARSQWYSRSEEHTSELQSRVDLVCRLLLEKKKKKKKATI